MNTHRNFILLGLISLLTALSCSSHHTPTEEKGTYEVSFPIQQDTVLIKEYVSQIRAYQHIELRALEKGYLQEIFVDEGQHVKKGQLMFRVMPLIYQAEMQKAKAEANYAEIEYLNTKSLADKDIVSANELALAKAHLEKAQAELNLAQAHLSFTEIRAPFNGIMGRFEVRLGSMLEEGELLTTLSDNSKVWVYFNVPEAEYLDLATVSGLQNLPPVNLQLANQQIFDQVGIIETIESDFNNETGNIAFRATFPNQTGILRHGETGNIYLPVPFENALLIPQKATYEVLDKRYVFVVNADGKVSSQEVEVIGELPHLYILSGGLDPKAMILMEGLRKVKNNDKIDFKLVDTQVILKELHALHAE
ncbi:efflux RND transporter periplasmic adaptor subunit [Algoriphagus namhaensis]